MVSECLPIFCAVRRPRVHLHFANLTFSKTKIYAADVQPRGSAFDASDSCVFVRKIQLMLILATSIP